MIDRNRYNRLLILIGQYAITGSSDSIDLLAKEHQKELININLEFSKFLLETISPTYFSKLKSHLENLITKKQSTFLIYPEILFEPSLHLETFHFFKDVSKVIPITVAIQNASLLMNKNNNTIDKLVYATPNHAEYKEMKVQDLRDVSIMEPKKLYKWEDSIEIS